MPLNHFAKLEIRKLLFADFFIGVAFSKVSQ